MPPETDRIERLLEDELAECCAADVEERVAELEAAVRPPRGHERDRRALRTLGDETRHRIVRLLVELDREACVCEIAPVVDVTESAISHALSDLTEAGLVSRRKEGTWRYYDATERASALVEALDTTRDGTREGDGGQQTAADAGKR